LLVRIGVDALITDRRVRGEVHVALHAPILVEEIEEVHHVGRDEKARRMDRRESELVVEVHAALPRLLQVIALQDARRVRVESD
jgi:hypothetical protein